MTEFKDLKSKWEQQPQVETPKNGSKDIFKKINFLKKKQRITNFVLLVTVLILIGFSFYIDAYNNVLVSFALFLMIGSLMIRVIIEHLSIKKLNQLDVTTNVTTFNTLMATYYKKRIKTHYIATPIILILYIIGFVILLPFFKENLSYGFYMYIIISSMCIFLILIVFIGKQIKKELTSLKQIKN
ncbi:hypothetical protein [Xanthomarina sp. GH4-25]|uniref:hypothetical protein n=1 Tax=Xanthomarina sp. GH4-25 TaxID=3349335 RepID=UPI000D67523C|nr:hypothetical protein DI383_08925 [Flavobacteriaceae bacterium LYZ1037]